MERLLIQAFVNGSVVDAAVLSKVYREIADCRAVLHAESLGMVRWKMGSLFGGSCLPIGQVLPSVSDLQTTVRAIKAAKVASRKLVLGSASQARLLEVDRSIEVSRVSVGTFTG